jgi:hypothetical protein
MTDRRTHRIDFENPCYDTEFATGILSALQPGKGPDPYMPAHGGYHPRGTGITQNVYGNTVDPLTVDQRRRKARAARRANLFRRMKARG